MAGPGKIQVADTPIGRLEARLYNFDVGKHELKPEHIGWLNVFVVGILKQGGSIMVTGTTSRTDPDSNNLFLSQRRVNAVLALLRKESPNNFAEMSFPTGESMPRAAGSRDKTEEDIWRGVMISVWARPKQPPLPPPVPKPAPPPPMIERRIAATFMVHFRQSGGGTMGDPRSATALADAMGEYNHRKYGGTLYEDRKALVPATYVCRQILISPNTSGSTSYPGISSTDMLSCRVDYEWGRRLQPHCFMVDRMMQRDPVWNGDPTVWALNDWQAARWVDNPFRAYFELKEDWDPLYYVNWKDYIKENYVLRKASL